MMRSVDRFLLCSLRNASCWFARLGGLLIVLSACLVTLEVFLRNLPGGMPAGIRLYSFELTNFSFAAAVAFGFAYALTQRAHIRIDVVYGLLPVGVRAVLDFLALVSLAGLAGGIAWQAWGVVGQSLKLGATPNSTLQVPLAVPQAIWAMGLSWFALVSLTLALVAAGQLVRGRLGELHALAGASTVGVERRE